MSSAEFVSLAAEQNVLGGLLIDCAAWAQISPINIVASDFSQPRNARIFDVIAELATASRPHDFKSVAEIFESRGNFQEVGGLAYLSELVRDTSASFLIRTYAEKLRDCSSRRCLHKLGKQLCDDGLLSERSISEILAYVEQSVGDVRKASTTDQPQEAPQIVLRHLADIVEERREPEWLDGLYKILERGVLAVLAGKRGSFKSFIALYWAMLAALAGQAVVILSGEGAGLDRRVDALMRRYAPAVDISSLRIVALERAVNLNAMETFVALEAAFTACNLAPDLVVIDTFSKFAPGLDENDNTAVALYLSILSTQLRERYGCTALLVAHAGHGDSKRPRGASVLMANPDAEYIVERSDPVGMTVTVTRERFKDSPSLVPLAYLAEIVDLQRTDRHGDPVTSLVVRDVDARDVPVVAVSKTAELRGGGQRQLLAALRAQKADGTAAVWSIGEIREVGRKAGLTKSTARSAAEALTFTPYLVPQVGGWRLKDE